MNGEKEHKHSSILCCDCIHQDIASRAHTAGAAQERAAIVAFLRSLSKERPGPDKWSLLRSYGLQDVLGTAWNYMACALERGEHAKGEK